MLLKDLIDLKGASGAHYRFRHAADSSGLPSEGGNFVYVKDSGGSVELVFSGVSDTLQDTFSRWTEAKSQHGASSAYFRLNITRSTRDREHEDIISECLPAMNR